MKEYFKTENGVLYHGDCLEVMPELAKQGVKFDLVLADPPYGTSLLCKWDEVIPFDKMWNCIKSLINGVKPICLFGTEPFSSKLRISNIKNYKYDWYWKKDKSTNFTQAKNMPRKMIEIISLFSFGGAIYHEGMTKRRIPYYPQGLRPCNRLNKNSTKRKTEHRNLYNKYHKKNEVYATLKTNYPTTCIEFYSKGVRGLHPTQKPVDLYKYLIKTYTLENELVLDFCAGSGPLGVACEQLNRRWVMIEKEEKYCEVIKERFLDNNIVLK